jgi:hypothetical protein
MMSRTPVAISEADRRFISVGKVNRLRSVPGSSNRKRPPWNRPDQHWLSLILHLFRNYRAIFLRGQTGRDLKLTVEPHRNVCSSVCLMYISIIVIRSDGSFDSKLSSSGGAILHE